jgi:hypothetical protein
MTNDETKTPPSALSRFARAVLLPIGVTIGLTFIAVALIEGPALEQFLYAVF